VPNPAKPGKFRKVPQRLANGHARNAGYNDRSIWRSWDAVEQLEADDRWHRFGWSFVESDTGIVCVDFDEVRNRATEGTQAWAVGLCKAFGSFVEVSPSGTGLHLWLRLTSASALIGARGKLWLTDGKHTLEVFSKQGFVTLTGHVPASGWQDIRSMTGAEFDATLTGWRALVDEQEPGTDKPGTLDKPDAELRAAEPALLRAALDHIPNDADVGYQLWARIGYAVKAALGDDGFDAFDAWSQKYPDYDARATRQLFECARPKKIGAGTIYHLAEKAGWQRPVDQFAARGESTSKRARGKSQAHTLSGVVMNDVVERDLESLWPGVLWIGKPTLVAGDPGLGKSLLTLDIAARVSRGACWPCSGEVQTAGDVALLSAEDDAADVIKPRLMAAGADCSRILLLTHVNEIDADGEVKRRSVQLDKHIDVIRQRLAEHPRPIKLLIVDPLGAYLGDTDSHNNSEVRAVLAQLAELAAELRLAVLCVSHLNKGDSGNALYKISGSLAFVAAARAVYIVDKDPQDTERVLFVAAKSNYGTTDRNYAFTKSEADNGAPRIVWTDEPVTRSASDLFAHEATARERTVNVDVQRAVDWLHAELMQEPRPGREIEYAAEAAGISERDLLRATRRMRIIKTPGGFGQPWMWSLPVSDT
jgi:hypothetical protein